MHTCAQAGGAHEVSRGFSGRSGPVGSAPVLCTWSVMECACARVPASGTKATGCSVGLGMSPVPLFDPHLESRWPLGLAGRTLKPAIWLHMDSRGFWDAHQRVCAGRHFSCPAAPDEQKLFLIFSSESLMCFCWRRVDLVALFRILSDTDS